MSTVLWEQSFGATPLGSKTTILSTSVSLYFKYSLFKMSRVLMCIYLAQWTHSYSEDQKGYAKSHHLYQSCFENQCPNTYRLFSLKYLQISTALS